MLPGDILSSPLNHLTDSYPTPPFGRPALQPGEIAAGEKTEAGAPAKTGSRDSSNRGNRALCRRKLNRTRGIRGKMKAGRGNMEESAGGRQRF